MVESAWQIWLLGIGIVLAVFFVIDYFSFQKFESSKARVPESELHEKGEADGLPNIFFLAVIVAASLSNTRSLCAKFLMVAAAAGSYFSTKKEIHVKNDFNFVRSKR